MSENKNLLQVKREKIKGGMKKEEEETVKEWNNKIIKLCREIEFRGKNQRECDTIECLQCLQTGTGKNGFFNDLIIEDGMEVVKSSLCDKTQVQFLNSFSMNHYCKKEHYDEINSKYNNPEADFRSVTAIDLFGKKTSIDLEFNKSSFVVIPINITNLHWVLGIIHLNIESRCIEPYILDSYTKGRLLLHNNHPDGKRASEIYPNYETTYKCYAKNIQHVFNDFFDDVKDITYIQVPEQTTGYDCGTYMLLFAKEFIICLNGNKLEKFLSGQHLNEICDQYKIALTRVALFRHYASKLNKSSSEYPFKIHELSFKQLSLHLVKVYSLNLTDWSYHDVPELCKVLFELELRKDINNFLGINTPTASTSRFNQIRSHTTSVHFDAVNTGVPANSALQHGAEESASHKHDAQAAVDVPAQELVGEKTGAQEDDFQTAVDTQGTKRRSETNTSATTQKRRKSTRKSQKNKSDDYYYY